MVGSTQVAVGRRPVRDLGCDVTIMVGVQSTTVAAIKPRAEVKERAGLVSPFLSSVEFEHAGMCQRRHRFLSLHDYTYELRSCLLFLDGTLS